MLTPETPASPSAGPAPGAGQRRIPWPLVIFLIGVAAGLAMVFVGFRAQSMVDKKVDPYYFGKMGLSVAEGRGFMPFGNLIQRRAPMYPLVIAGIYSIAGEKPTLVYLLQCLFLGGTCFLAFDMGRRVFNQRTGIIAGVVCAMHPMMLRYVSDLHLETQLTFFFTLTIWGMVRFWPTPTIAWGAFVGAAAAVGSLTKAVVFPYAGIFAIGMVLRAWSARRRGEAARPPWLPLATLFVVMGLCILPWTIRNYVATGGKFVPISSGMSDAVLRGYVFSQPDYALLRKPPYTDAENESNRLLHGICRDAGIVCEQNDWETDQALNKAAKARILADPAAFVRKFFVGIFTFWYELTSFKNSLLVAVLALGAWIFAIIGWRRARREGRPTWLLLGPVIYLNVLLALLLALGRYSVPILPALLVVAAFGADTLLSSRRRATTGSPSA